MTLLLRCLAIFVLAAFPLFGAAQTADAPVRISVQADGDALLVSSDAVVRASPQEVWAVLTDFDHMAGFISNLRTSRVLSRSDHSLVVQQTGLASAGWLSFKFDSVREMELLPFTRIHSRQLSGSMSFFEGTMTLRQEGEMTRIESRVRAVPGTWVPPVVGKRFVESETREQFSELLAEILRRQELARR